jgi:hypothetical protein
MQEWFLRFRRSLKTTPKQIKILQSYNFNSALCHCVPRGSGRNHWYHKTWWPQTAKLYQISVPLLPTESLTSGVYPPISGNTPMSRYTPMSRGTAPHDIGGIDHRHTLGHKGMSLQCLWNQPQGGHFHKQASANAKPQTHIQTDCYAKHVRCCLCVLNCFCPVWCISRIFSLNGCLSEVFPCMGSLPINGKTSHILEDFPWY